MREGHAGVHNAALIGKEWVYDWSIPDNRQKEAKERWDEEKEEMDSYEREKDAKI